MKSERCMLKPGTIYRLHTDREDHQAMVLECLRTISDSAYSPYTAIVRSTRTGWTMFVHGTNMYEDGSIDWDFSTNGYFSILDN